MNGLRMNLFAFRRSADSPRRRGITILEVLIAAGVLAIGMFGVMAMIPLIAMRLREGEIADRSAVLSRNAVEEVQVRGWTDPRRWRWYRTDGTYIDPSNGVLARTEWQNWPALPAPSNLPASPAICVDPQGMTGLVGGNANRVAFPFETLGPRYVMQRVTPFPLTNSAAPNNSTDQGIAEVGAVAEDDLLFERPKSRTDLPFQTFPVDRNVSTAAVDQTRRMAQRDYSYMATLTPLDNVITFNGRGNYLLSAVVFYQRSRTYEDEHVGSISPVVTTNALGEAISGFPSGGVSGGDVVINCGADPEMLDVTKGDWVMLTYPRQLDGSGNVTQPAYHRWYQVIEASPYNLADVDGSGNALRRVTLAGPDWPGVGATMADLTQVTWLPGVASVSEKTITLGSGGAWK